MIKGIVRCAVLVAAALMLMLPRYSSKPVVEQVSTSDLAPGAGV